MKWFTALPLLIAALISAAVCVPYLPSAKEQQAAFSLEVKLAATVGGHLQLFYDDGRGFDEGRSSTLPIVPSPGARTYALALPAGTYRQLRLDPTDNAVAVTLSSARIVSADHRIVRELSLAELQPANDIATLRRHGGSVEVMPVANSHDAQLLLTFEPPLVLQPTQSSLWSALLLRAVPIFVLFALALFACERIKALRPGAVRVATGIGRHPACAVWFTACIAVVVSSIPVVFLGKSYVSPNFGTPLLYEDFPTTPGYTDATKGDAHGSDVGAVMWQQVPNSVVEAHALRHGELPWWNRYNSAGTPLIGQGQSMFGDPVHLIVLAAGGASWAWDLKYLVAKALFAAALGLLVLALAREGDEGRSRWAGPAALVVAAAAPFIGAFTYWFNHPALFSFCYAPWPLYCWLRASQAGTWRGAARWAGGLMVANLALMNSGTAKEAYVLLLTMNAAGVALLLTDTTALATRLRKLALLAWAGVLFTLLTAPLWRTFVNDLQHSYTSYNSASAYQLQPTLLLGVFDEALLRPLTAGALTFAPSLNFIFLLGLLYFCATLRTHFGDRRAMILAVASMVPLAIAFGLVPPAWIMRVPYLGNISHVDTTFIAALLIFWAVLAGLGCVQAAARLGTSAARGDFVIVVVLLGGLVFGWIAFGQAVHRPIVGPSFSVNEPGHALVIAPFLWTYLATLLVACAAIMLGAHCLRAAHGFRPVPLMIVGLAAFVLCWRFALHGSSAGFETYVLRPTARAPLQAQSPAVGFVQAEQARSPGRALGTRGNFFPGWNDAYRLETVAGPDALSSPRYRELINAFPGITRIWDWRLYLDPAAIATVRPLFDLLNVRFYFDRNSDPAVLERAVHRVLSADLDVYESATVWPRAFFAPAVLPYDRVEDLIDRIRGADGHAFAAVQNADLASGRLPSQIARSTNPPAIVAASQYKLTDNSTSFDVRASGAGIVALTEAWWPGDVRAFLNGQKVPTIAVNHAFMGVTVPRAGDYHVEFRYRPRGWMGDLISFWTGMFLLVASTVVIARGARRARRPVHEGTIAAARV